MVDTLTLTDFLLPSLGSDMESGTVIEWLVAPGDLVHKGDVLVRVDTEKAEIDVEVWHDATVAELLVQVGEHVPVGTALARLNGGEPEPKTERKSTIEADSVPVPQPVPSQPAPSPPAREADRDDPRRVSPRMVFWPSPIAVPEAQSRPPVSRHDLDVDPLTRDQRRQGAVAALMEQANREIPHFHVTREIDLTDALVQLAAQNAELAPPQRILPAALLLHAVAHAASATPVNGTSDLSSSDLVEVNLGVAVHLRGGGLVTPVIGGAQDLTLDELMAELKAKVNRARSGRMNARDLSAASLTVTNLGDTGADRVLGIIRPPQRALVGFGTMRELPRVVDGTIVVRSVVDATITGDHRLVNGHAAARFLNALTTRLNEFSMTPNPTALTPQDASPKDSRNDD